MKQVRSVFAAFVTVSMVGPLSSCSVDCPGEHGPPLFNVTIRAESEPLPQDLRLTFMDDAGFRAVVLLASWDHSWEKLGVECTRFGAEGFLDDDSDAPATELWCDWGADPETSHVGALTAEADGFEKAYAILVIGEIDDCGGADAPAQDVTLRRSH